METEGVHVKRIPREIEKPFRDALGHAVRNEFEDLKETLFALTDEQIEACLNLCGFAAGYVAIDVCGRQWPDEDNRRSLAQAATKSSNAQDFGLTQHEAYDYLVRVVLGSERLDEVFPPDESEGNHDAITLSFVITGQLLLSFHPEGIKWWDYLNIIENVYEVTATADLAILPGLILVSRKLGSPRVFGEAKRS
jgi:hypothetical protein